MSDSPEVIALVRDLLLGSRVSAAAQRLGLSVRMLRDPSKLAELSGRRVLVDLNEPGAMEAAAGWRSATAGREAIGFVSHVDAATAGRARELGIDRVLARSRFVEILAELLTFA